MRQQSGLAIKIDALETVKKAAIREQKSLDEAAKRWLEDIQTRPQTTTSNQSKSQ